MATHYQWCAICGCAFESVRGDARACSSTCRSRAHRRRQALTEELLRRQTLAVQSGDQAAIADLVREAQHLLGTQTTAAGRLTGTSEPERKLR